MARTIEVNFRFSLQLQNFATTPLKTAYRPVAITKVELLLLVSSVQMASTTHKETSEISKYVVWPPVIKHVVPLGYLYDGKLKQHSS